MGAGGSVTLNSWLNPKPECVADGTFRNLCGSVKLYSLLIAGGSLGQR